MKKIEADSRLDAKGLACPMPIVKTKKAIGTLESGQVLAVEATDKGSRADIQAWAESAGHSYLGTLEAGDVLTHYVRKTTGEDKVERTYPHITDNAALEAKLAANEAIIVLDVREQAEYAFNHIQNAISIPLGELDARAQELEPDAEIYVVCRTGSRSDLAARKLAAQGFTHVVNVVPGMSEWTGKTESVQ